LTEAQKDIDRADDGNRDVVIVKDEEEEDLKKLRMEALKQIAAARAKASK
jgi:hypothetical protein